MKELSRIDTTLLYPPFAAKVDGLIARALNVGASYWAISGYRSYSEQEALYAQGRTSPGPVVTQARGGESAHNFGIAVDFCRDGFIDRAGLQPDYRPESYDILGNISPHVGLVWGGSWLKKDLPHVQWPGYVTGAQLLPLAELFEAGGMRAVWDHLDGVCR